MTAANWCPPAARSSASPRLRSFDLDGPAGRLEAVLNEGCSDARFAALVCHPHPLGGGSLHNKVVYRAMKVLNAAEFGLEWPVLRFNFRGTGRSEGTHDGAAESADVQAALRWLENEYKLPTVVVGFSFGAAMALKACCTENPERDAEVKAVAALGLPTHAMDRVYRYPFLAHCTLPKLFLSGDKDQFAPSSELTKIFDTAGGPKRLVLLPQADHFFDQQLDPMQQALAAWIKEQVL